MKILVCGSRNWDSIEIIEHILDDYAHAGRDIIIHGNCEGADRMAGLVAVTRKIDVRPYPADWSRYGRAAGPIRNQEMLDKEEPDLVIAFHENLVDSRGTKDMVTRALVAGLSIVLVGRMGRIIYETTSRLSVLREDF